MKFDVDWVDAFTDRAFGGNGCAVVHDAARLDDETCMAFVRETSLVECTFTGPSETADIRVRYFLASREIPFAGHPTVATVAALRHRGLIADGPLTLETGAGIVPVEVSGTSVRMTQVAPTFGARPDPGLVASVGGLTAGDIIHPPRVSSTGLPFTITVLRDRATLDSVRFDMDAFRAYLDALGVHGTDVMEPFWCTLGGATSAGDTFARLLMAPPSPAEDPFTGSATGAMAAYLWSEGLIDSPTFVAEQGHGLGRPGQASVEVLGPRDAITGVMVEGQAHVLMSGTLHL
ncbi:PhzF family phenazine biosynthesis protein [Tateyamaria sp. ANG-S1]|uniref:PhzF family phenazine biosynthesis protein n=1 Tax=Tateyamaria sp. ANG-S1 TaxID=1577905 RepID=UPI00057C484A|nr:PhzF family phenazine biosynthesis protein [Tateyamaria sp. ANG-S1]KIC50509.1 phenazine biosynthesis protein PhzF [Tateyamaria sp. ANG-S1]